MTPALLLLLLSLIILGLATTSEIKSVSHSQAIAFFYGLKEGYHTMDLLAAFFFSAMILRLLETEQKPVFTAFRASLIGLFLLALIYIGLSYLAAYHGQYLMISGKDELLPLLAFRVAGPIAGNLVCVTVALACLTTAIALVAAFTDYLQREFFRDKLSYEWTLAGTLVTTFCISILDFQGISAFLSPILSLCYPSLIVLTLLNILHHFTNFKPVKIPILITFCLTCYFN